MTKEDKQPDKQDGAGLSIEELHVATWVGVNLSRAMILHYFDEATRTDRLAKIAEILSASMVFLAKARERGLWRGVRLAVWDGFLTDTALAIDEMSKAPEGSRGGRIAAVLLPALGRAISDENSFFDSLFDSFTRQVDSVRGLPTPAEEKTSTLLN